MVGNGLTAVDVMSSPVRVLDRYLSLAEAVRILSDEGISAAPVVGSRGEPVGVVSLADIAVYLAGLERSLGRLGGFYFRNGLRWDPTSESYSNLDTDEDVLHSTQVDEVMTAEVYSVGPDASLAAIAREMCQRGIHRVLVLEDDLLKGLVSTLDVMKVVADEH